MEAKKEKKKRSKNNPSWKNQSSNQGNMIPDCSKERSKTIARYPQDPGMGMQGIGGGKPGGEGKNKKYKMLGVNGAEEHSSNDVCIMHGSLHERYAVCNMGQMQ